MITDDERQALVDGYLADHQQRGGIVDEEAQRQALAYADRIAASRQYEADRHAALQQQAERMREAAPAAAARSHYAAVAKAAAEARSGWNTAPDAVYGRAVVERVRAHEDGERNRKDREASAARIARHRDERQRRVDALIEKLRKAAGDDPAALVNLARAATVEAQQQLDIAHAVELEVYRGRIARAAQESLRNA